MQALNKYLVICTIFSVGLMYSCKKDVQEKEVLDNIIYQLDTTRLYASGAEKTKQKSPAQYISIMYSDLFSYNISSTDLSELSELNLALGDKSMANELTLSHYLKSNDVDKPSDAQMRADVESFVEDTYRRFYQRNPLPYEKLYMTDVINKDPQITVSEVYTAFVLSDEYYHY